MGPNPRVGGGAAVATLLSRWAFRIPTALVLAFAWTVTLPGGWPVSGSGWGADGLWWAFAVSAVASFLVGVAWFLRGTWQEGVIEGERVPTSDD